MADIAYSQDANSYNLQTQPGSAFNVPAAGDMSGFFEAMALKKAKAAKEAADEDRRRWEAEFRLREQSMQPQEQARPQMMQPQEEPSLRQRGLVEQRMGIHGMVDFVDPLNLKPSEMAEGMGGVYGNPSSRFQRGAYANAGGGFGYDKAL